MILITAIIAGLTAGFLRAAWNKRKLNPLPLKSEWLVFIAFLPQLIAFQLPATRTKLSDRLVRAALVSSQLVLLVFAWRNRKAPGSRFLGAGLALNFLVIILNGGLMPISPEIIKKYLPNAPTGTWTIGDRLGATKDIVLNISETRFWWLSDRFTLPDWFNYPVAFSFGDILIWIGAFWLLWSLGASQTSLQEN